jgi:hypothetical protein
VEDLDVVQRLATAAILTMKLVGGFFPIVPMKLAGSGKRSLNPASRGTTEVANPCFGR